MASRAAKGRGFTLVELLVAMSLMFIGLMGLLSLQIVATRAAVQARRITEALSLAQDRVERLRRLPISSVTSATEAKLTEKGTTDPTGGLYTRVTTVTPAGTSFVISVAVSWPDLQNRPHTITIRTVRAP